MRLKFLMIYSLGLISLIAGSCSREEGSRPAFLNGSYAISVSSVRRAGMFLMKPNGIHLYTPLIIIFKETWQPTTQVAVLPNPIQPLPPVAVLMCGMFV